MATRGEVSGPARRSRPERDLWIGVARAFGGAIFFSLPLLMTMEMWWLGFYMDRLRIPAQTDTADPDVRLLSDEDQSEAQREGRQQG